MNLPMLDDAPAPLMLENIPALQAEVRALAREKGAVILDLGPQVVEERHGWGSLVQPGLAGRVRPEAFVEWLRRPFDDLVDKGAEDVRVRFGEAQQVRDDLDRDVLGVLRCRIDNRAALERREQLAAVCARRGLRSQS